MLFPDEQRGLDFQDFPVPLSQIRCKSTAFFRYDQTLKLIVKCCISALSKTKIACAKTLLKRKLQILKQNGRMF